MWRREMSPLSFLPFFVLLLLTATADKGGGGGGGGGTPGGGSTSSSSSTLFLLTGYKPPASLPRPPVARPSRGPAKEAEVHGEEAPGLETLPKPLPQRGSNVSAADALKPPLGAAKVAPAPRQLVDTDACRGYFDVMGQFDSPFNCSKDTYIYCCGTCHYRFCCEHQRNRLDQNSCTNYISPVWANTQMTATAATGNRPDPDFETLLQQSSSTTYVIGGVISFTLVMAVGVRIAFSKFSRRPRNRDINMPRALVDILRHQSSPVQPGAARNNTSTILTTTSTTAPDGRMGSKNLYAPSALQSKDNRSIGIGNLQHPFKQQGAGSSPKHSATIERPPPRIMNNSQLPVAGGSLALGGGGGGGGGTLPNSKHSNNMFTSTSFSSSLSRPVPPHGAHHSHLYHQGQQQRQPSSHPFSHSFHNLAQLPPSYESAVKPDISRYCSLKRLEKELDDYSGYYTSSKRRSNNNAPPSFHSSQHHLQYGGGGGGDYTLGARGTLPLHGSRPRLQLTSTPNPYPLPPQQQQPAAAPYSAFDRPPRRVRSQDELLAFGEGNTLSRLQSSRGQQQYYKGGMSSSKTAQTLRRSQERLLVSPDRLEERLMAMGLLVGDRRVSGGAGGGGGGVPTMGRLSHNHKAQSQQNICATTPSLDRHHMIKMNSHPTSGHEQSSTPPARGGGWDPHGGSGSSRGPMGGGGSGGGHPNARRMAFASKRQNTIEQLHFIPGGGGGGGGQGLRTGSKNEVTV